MTVEDVLKRQDNYIALISFKCDEGVRRNAGRVGTAQGPQSIKSMLASVPWRLEEITLIDVGVVACEGTQLVKYDKVRCFDICEMNPVLDIDQRTPKLAAY